MSETGTEDEIQRTPAVGEIWQDAEGTLMCAATYGGWWVFGVARPIPEDAPKIAHPLARVFDVDGDFVGDHLHYPDRPATGGLGDAEVTS